MPGFGELTSSPKSAARLAAEAAFAAPAVQAPSTPPTQITVRKRRAATPEPDAALGPDAGDADGLLTEPASQGPRIFRVDTVKEAGADPDPDLGSSQTETGDPASTPRWSQRARRAQLQRPGPVTHTVLALPAQPVDFSVQQLKADLAAVEPVLEAIRRAQHTSFIDRSGDSAWQALSSRLDALSLELQLQLLQQA